MIVAIVEGGGGTNDYDRLANKPAIDGTALNKDSTAMGLGLETTAGTASAIAQEVNDRNGAIAAAVLSTHKWLPAVESKAELPNPETLSPTLNYLCRVIKDADAPANNGVWQLVAGAAEWTYFSDNRDWVDENELNAAIAAKVDKITQINRVYATNQSGAQTSYTLSKDVYEDTVAWRGTNGTVKVGTPTDTARAATKEYTDTTVANIGNYKNTVQCWTGVSGEPSMEVTVAQLKIALKGAYTGRIYIYDPKQDFVLATHGSLTYFDIEINSTDTPLIRRVKFTSLFNDGYRGLASVTNNGDTLTLNFSGDSIMNNRLRVYGVPGLVDFNVAIPVPPAIGNHSLQSVNGVISWVTTV
jgi:hypothetical protein